jgi:predicted RNA binding protein YcfA (HicA-like mRNA interferase family)
MSKLAKLIKRVCSSPPEAGFDDVERLLLLCGWTLRGCEGSHCVFVKPGDYPITVPKHGGQKVKRRYCDLVCERLGLDEEP